MKPQAVNMGPILGKLIWFSLFFNSFADASETNAGRVTAISGNVRVIQGVSVVQAKVGMQIRESDRIQTASGGVVQVRFSDGSSFTVYEKSSIFVEQYRETSGRGSPINSAIDIAYGKLRFFVNPSGSRKKDAKFKTKTSVMGIRGTSGVIDAVDGGATQLLVLTGKVQVVNPGFPGVEVLVGPKSLTKVNPGAAPLPPSPASDALIKASVPPAPSTAGFTDDSSAASQSAGQFPNEQESPKSSPGGSDGDSTDKSEEKQETPEPSGDKSNGKTDESGSGRVDAKPAESNPQNPKDQPKTSSATQSEVKNEATDNKQPPQTRSVKPVFSPGGEVVNKENKSVPTIDVKGAGASSAAGSTPSKDNKPALSGESNQPGSKVDAVPITNVIKQVERATSQVNTTIETVEKKVQTTLQVPPTPAPSPSKIRIKMNLPQD